jgi:hypothetical protein
LTDFFVLSQKTVTKDIPTRQKRATVRDSLCKTAIFCATDLVILGGGLALFLRLGFGQPVQSVGVQRPLVKRVKRKQPARPFTWMTLSSPGLLHGRTIRPTISSGEIVAVNLDFDRSGFTIVDHRDSPRRNVVALIDDDQH